MDVRTSTFEVLFLMFWARVKMYSNCEWRCSRSLFVACLHKGNVKCTNYTKLFYSFSFTVCVWFLTWRCPIVVLISSESPTVTMLDFSICVMRRSQSASSVAVLFRSVGATVSGVWGVWWWGTSLTKLAICTAEGTADTKGGPNERHTDVNGNDAAGVKEVPQKIVAPAPESFSLLYMCVPIFLNTFFSVLALFFHVLLLGITGLSKQVCTKLLVLDDMGVKGPWGVRGLERFPQTTI